MKKLPYNRVVGITVLVAILSMVIGVVVIDEVRQHLVKVTTEQYKKQQVLLADQVAETLSNNFINVENQLRLMATMPEVQNIDDTEGCNAKLAEILQINQKQLGNLARTDPNGVFVCSVNRAIIGQNSAQYGSYVTEMIADPNHQPVLGRLSKPAGTDSFATGLHVPVYKDGAYYGSVGGALYFNRFQDEYLKSIKYGNGGHVVLMDDNADILYHPSPQQNGENLLDPKIIKLFEPQATMRNLVTQVKAGKSGELNYTVQGIKKISVYKTFNVANTSRHWSVIVTIPAEDIGQAIDDAGINQILPAIFLLFTITTALLTFIGLRNILKNLEVQQMKDDFISITSHQLRTPATVVKQNLGLILGGFVSSKKDTDKFIASAYQSNENQLSIIENILSVSKLEAGRLELQKQDLVLQDLVAEMARIMQSGIDIKKQTLKLTVPKKSIHINADPTKLGMAVENLLSNAIKYTPKKGKITLVVAAQDGIVKISVSDNGQGVAADDIAKLFRRFNRLESALVSHVPGTGLGLYLTKKIVEMHGGKISVESKENIGSTFTIELPLH